MGAFREGDITFVNDAKSWLGLLQPGHFFSDFNDSKLEKSMIECLAICTCSNMQNKSEQAFRLLFRDEPIPPVARGRDKITQLADKYPNTNVSKYLKAIARKVGKFAYFIRATDDGDVSEVYDLLKGKKVA